MTAIIGEGAHRSGGTDYGLEGAKSYAKAKHGPDGYKFLDPFFLRYLKDLSNQFLIDIGCGAGPWAVYAAKQGAKVFAIDYQRGMLKNAKEAVNEANVGNNVTLIEANGAAIPAVDREFNLALSINVGCNLPNTSRENVTNPSVGFEPHFQEMARVLKHGGKAIVTAPTSFGEIFTRGTREKRYVKRAIKQKLKIINDEIGQIPTEIKGNERKVMEDSIVKKHLNTLDDVYRATFAYRENKWVLITNENQLMSGEKIWRKLPGLTVPNNYHNENEYIKAAENAGLKVVKQFHELFHTEKERRKYNSSVETNRHLGKEYSKELGGKPPFVVYVFEKP